MLENIVIISEEEKIEVRRLNETIEALNELYLGFENLDIEEKEKQTLLENMRSKAGFTEKSINQWWMNVKEKYSIKHEENSRWRLEYDSNKLVIKN